VSGQVLVAGIGNVFRTDDGFGPAVVGRLATLPGMPREGVRIADYGIRGMHLAYDLLQGWDALILVDAVPDRGAAGRVEVLRIGPDDIVTGAAVDAHGMDPATVLATLASLGGRLPENTVLVGCQVSDVGDGMGLTPVVEAAVDVAASTVRSLVARLGAAGVEVS
jgi:hydrogenase maturation protease